MGSSTVVSTDYIGGIIVAAILAEALGLFSFPFLSVLHYFGFLLQQLSNLLVHNHIMLSLWYQRDKPGTV